ncbi:MAG: TetR/AcrR family transcriptional regulator [Pirellulaceae bacterium]
MLDKATELFWKQGFESTTLDDILKATGFNRHSLYNEFGSKEGLFIEVLKNYRAQSNERLTPLAEQRGLEALNTLFDVRRPFDGSGRGCLFTSTINERHCVPPEAFDISRSSYRGVEDMVYGAVRQAQEDGEIPAEKDPKSLAQYVVLILQGLGTMSKAGMTENEASKLTDQTLAFLQQ